MLYFVHKLRKQTSKQNKKTNKQTGDYKMRNFDPIKEQKKLEKSVAWQKAFFVAALIVGLVFVGGLNLGGVLQQAMSFIG